MARERPSVRSRGSSSSSSSNPRKKIRNFCRKFVAFMFTQVGVGGLIVAYAVVGAGCFISIEMARDNKTTLEAIELRRNFSFQLWDEAEKANIFNKSEWTALADKVLKTYQDRMVELIIKKGYDTRPVSEVWTLPSALMYCLSIFTMIGYGNLVPRTDWGKGLTIAYATFGIPLYILYFLNMGKALAKSFKFLYRIIHEYSREKMSDDDDGHAVEKKPIIVPSTACLWILAFYILTGTITFAQWEKWTYLDSVYFCVTSLCKLGFGDFVPGIKDTDSKQDKEIKLAITFIYLLVGMGLVAMCYRLMREEVKVRLREIKEDCNLCLEGFRARFEVCCKEEADEYVL